MNQDIIVSHPYKHHALNLAAGCILATRRTALAMPLYQKGLGAMISYLPGPIGRKARGYYHSGLPETSVLTSSAWHARKLRTYLVSRPKDIESPYDTYVSGMIGQGQWASKILVTLQDHMPKTADAGKRKGMLLWSDQIINLSTDAVARINKHCREFSLPEIKHDETANNQILSAADFVTVPSTYTLQGIEQRLTSGCKVEVIPYGVHPMFGVASNRKIEKYSILARANSVRKGGHLFFRALLALKGRLSGVNVRILGNLEPCLFPLFDKVQRDCGLDIKFGDVPNADVPSLMQEASVFVLPTLSESMSLACAEAMRSGLPIITTKYAGMDYFVSGRMGLLIEDNVSSLADALDDAYTDSSKWQTWGQAGQICAAAHDWAHYESNISRLAKAAISGE